MLNSLAFNMINLIIYLTLALGLTSLIAFVLTLKNRKKWSNISIPFLSFTKDAAQLLGLLGTILALYKNKEVLLTAKSLKALSGMFLGAWSTTLIGIIVSLGAFFLLSILTIPEDENEK